MYKNQLMLVATFTLLILSSFFECVVEVARLVGVLGLAYLTINWKSQPECNDCYYGNGYAVKDIIKLFFVIALFTLSWLLSYFSLAPYSAMSMLAGVCLLIHTYVYWE